MFSNMDEPQSIWVNVLHKVLDISTYHTTELMHCIDLFTQGLTTCEQYACLPTWLAIITVEEFSEVLLCLVTIMVCSDSSKR